MQGLSGSTLGSSIALLGVAALTLLAVLASFRWVSSGAVAFALMVALILAAAVGIYFVDVSVPLAQSHFRPKGEPAPVWMALLIWATRVAAVSGLICFERRSKSASTRAR